MKQGLLFLIVVSLLISFAPTGVADNSEEELKKLRAELEDLKKYRTMKIGVVDLNEISEKYEKHKSEIESLKEQTLEIEEELEKLKEEMESQEERRDFFEKGSDKYDEHNLRYEELRIKLMVKQNTEKKKLKRKQVALIKELYSSIRKAVKRYAEKHGYQLIMVKLSDEVFSSELKGVLTEIRIKPVIYASEKLDLTDEIIDFMNAQYAKELNNPGSTGNRD